MNQELLAQYAKRKGIVPVGVQARIENEQRALLSQAVVDNLQSEPFDERENRRRLH